jgi:hypothetical protein
MAKYSIFKDTEWLYAVARIVGFHTSNAIERLIYTTMILLITTVQIRVLSNGALIRMLDDKKQEDLEKEFEKEKQTCGTVFFAYLTFIVYSILPLFL